MCLCLFFFVFVFVASVDFHIPCRVKADATWSKLVLFFSCVSEALRGCTQALKAYEPIHTRKYHLKIPLFISRAVM